MEAEEFAVDAEVCVEKNNKVARNSLHRGHEKKLSIAALLVYQP